MEKKEYDKVKEEIKEDVKVEDKKLYIEREQFKGNDEKDYWSYILKGQIRGRDVKVDFAPKDKGRYEPLDIIFDVQPKAELLVKCGLSNIATSKQILRLCDKDKNFCKWLFKNKDEIALNSVYISSIIKAYKNNRPIKLTDEIEYFKRNYNTYKNELKDFLQPNESEKFITYLASQNANVSSFVDYINACNFLDLNMNENKNRYPHNFQYWHDVRIDEMHTKQAEIDKEKRKELYKNFSNVANKYETLQRNLKDNFVVIIAKSPQDLIYEGDTLHHCVGRMNYDQKFAREESLIFFVRYKDNIQTPFVTLKYSLKNHKILQCYANHDSTPSDEVLDYVNKKWLPYANRKIRQIAI